MATVGAALRFRDCCEEADEQYFAGLKSLAPKLLTICVIFCAMSFAGCARNPAQLEASPGLHEGKAPSIRALVRTRRYSEPYRYAEPKIRRPNPALLSPCCRRPAHAKSSRFGNEGRRDNNPRSLATGRASATASAALTAASISTIYARAVDLNRPWLVFSRCLWCAAVHHLVFVLPFQPFTLCAVGFPPAAHLLGVDRYG